MIIPRSLPLPIDHTQTRFIEKQFGLEAMGIPVDVWEKARPRECFNNVKAYCIHHTNKKPKYGWLAWVETSGIIRLEAHAIVMGKMMFDITPHKESVWDTRTFFPDNALDFTENRIPDKIFPFNPTKPENKLRARIEQEATNLGAEFFKKSPLKKLRMQSKNPAKSFLRNTK
jgi:hypothetical protein